MTLAENNTYSLLVISGAELTPYAQRGVTQTLAHIDQASQLKRTINGNLEDISFVGFRKYKSSITGTDMKAPAWDDVWPGKTVTVDCVAELSYKTVGGTPSRPVVPDSSYTEGDYTFYRPRLTMKIIDYQQSDDEYGEAVSFTIDLEEV